MLFSFGNSREIMSDNPPGRAVPTIEKADFPDGINEVPLYILRKWKQEGQKLNSFWKENPKELQSKSEVMINDFVQRFGSELEDLLDKPLTCAVGVGGIQWIRLMSGSLQFSFLEVLLIQKAHSSEGSSKAS